MLQHGHRIYYNANLGLHQLSAVSGAFPGMMLRDSVRNEQEAYSEAPTIQTYNHITNLSK